MTTEHDSDSDATVRMPRPVVQKDVDLGQVEPESTLIREDWGSTAILPPPTLEATRQPKAAVTESTPKPDWELATVLRPAYTGDGGPR
jgi:hypothetical protein